MRSALCGGLCAIGLVAIGGAQQVPFRSRTDVVSLTVSVLKGRQPVTGLAPADFEVTDNGVRQHVDVVSLDRVPVDMTLVFTEFSAHRTAEYEQTMSSAESMRKSLAADDRLRVIFADHQVHGRSPAPGYSLAEDPMARELQFGRGTASGIVLPIRELGSHTGNREYGLGISIADALFYAMAWPVESPRRHLVVAFTDGHDTASSLEVKRLPKLAAHSDAVLHVVLWTTPGAGASSGWQYVSPTGGTNSREWLETFNVIDDAVQMTGGSLQRVQGASNALARIVDEFRSSYVLSYTPAERPAPGWHELKVKLTRPGSFTIRARKGYEAPGK